MRNVVFVAPFFLEATLRFLHAAATLHGARLALLSQDPLDRVPSRVRARLASHVRVDDALDPRQIVEGVHALAREIGPIQPLTLAQWNGNSVLNAIIYANSDIITFHDYNNVDKLAAHIEDLKRHGRPIINTEWLNRGRDSSVQTCLPVFRKENIGCLHWGLVNGKTHRGIINLTKR